MARKFDADYFESVVKNALGGEPQPLVVEALKQAREAGNAEEQARILCNLCNQMGGDTHELIAQLFREMMCN